MNPHDESRLAAHRPAFLRHLPRRVEKIGRRLHHFLQDGWDINGLALLNEDALSLGHACRQHGLDEAGQHFLHLHEALHESLQQQSLPDQETGERLWSLVEQIGQALGHDLAVAFIRPLESVGLRGGRTCYDRHMHPELQSPLADEHRLQAALDLTRQQTVLLQRFEAGHAVP